MENKDVSGSSLAYLSRPPAFVRNYGRFTVFLILLLVGTGVNAQSQSALNTGARELSISEASQSIIANPNEEKTIAGTLDTDRLQDVVSVEFSGPSWVDLSAQFDGKVISSDIVIQRVSDGHPIFSDRQTSDFVYRNALYFTEGTYLISVGSRSAQTGKLNYQLTLRVTEAVSDHADSVNEVEPNDFSVAANLLPERGIYQGSLSASDSDYLTFTVPSPGSAVDLRLAGSMDYFRLLDSELRVLDLFKSNKPSFRTELNLPAGQYYIDLHGTGKYKLKLTKNDLAAMSDARGYTSVTTKPAPINLPLPAISIVRTESLELAISAMSLQSHYADFALTEKNSRFLIVDVMIKAVPPTRGGVLEDPIALYSHAVNGPFLHWNGMQIIGLRPDMLAADFALPDPTQLNMPDDAVSAQIVFEVPAESPESGAALVLPYKKYGAPVIELFRGKPTFDFTSDQFIRSGRYQVKIDDINITPEGVNVIFAGFESDSVDSKASEAPENGLINLSSTVLFVDKDRVKPLHPADTSPVILLNQRVTRHSVWYPTADALEARDIGLVFALPAANPADTEPYWIIPLRGEPSIADLPDPFGQTRNSRITSPGKDATNSADKHKPHSPAWPDKPSAPRSYARIEKLSGARRASQADKADFEAVLPGKDAANAIELQLDNAIAAKFNKGQKVHFYKLPLLEPDQLAEIHLLNNAKKALRIELMFRNKEGDWKVVMRRSSELAVQGLKLDTQYWMSITGAKALSEYSLGVYATERALNDEAYEPSDSAALSSLPVKEHSRSDTGEYDQIELFGRFDAGNDTDYFRLVSPEPALATLEITPPGKITLYSNNGEIGRSKDIDKRAILTDVLVSAGETIFSVQPKNKKSTGSYAIRSTLYPLPGISSELEPNDKSSQAHRIVPDTSRDGRLPTKDDKDFYFFDWPGTGKVQIEIRGDAPESYRVDLSSGIDQVKLENIGAATYHAELAQGHYVIRLSSRAPSLKPYSLHLGYAPVAEPEDSSNSALQLTLDETQLRFKSYVRFPQAADLMLQIENTGSETQSVRLSAHVSHDCCQLEFSETELTLQAGQMEKVRVSVFARRDSNSESPFPVDLQVIQGEKKHLTRLWVGFSDDARARYRDWPDYPLPTALMGAWDVARADFGAYPVQVIDCACNDPVNTRKPVVGMQPYSTQSDLCAAAVHAGVITDQGGVIGARLTSLQTNYSGIEKNGVKSRQSKQSGFGVTIEKSNSTAETLCPKQFKLSDQRVESLLTGLPIVNKAGVSSSMVVALAAESTVTGFLLNTLGSNRQVKDVALSLSLDGNDFTQVSQLSLARGAGSTPVVLDRPVTARFVRVDLLSGFPPFENADGFKLDGLKVLASNVTDPIFPDGANLAQSHLGFEVFSQDSHNTTVAFHHKRRAQISTITLFNSAKAASNVSVFTSVDGPYGPWQSVGSLPVPANQEASLKLPMPTGVRYLNLRTSETDLEKIQIRLVRERAGDVDYRSILTEWGGETSAAGFEWLEALEPAVGESPTSSVDAPQPAVVGDRFTGQVSLRNAQQDYYRVSMPPAGNDLQLVFKGDPFFRARVEVRTPAGELLPVTVEAEDSKQIVRYLVPDSGENDFVDVLVQDTPRHLAVLWDDSGSVAPFIPGVLKLVGNMAFSLDSSWERLHLTPLHNKEDEFLTETWTSDPYAIAGAIRRYRKTGSSRSYLTLDHALDALAEVDGMRAVLILTDERGDRRDYPDNRIEKKIAAVAPTVFSFHMATVVALHDEQINRMQAWAGISGGRYIMLQSPDEVPQAFAKVQGWLREPLPYQFEVKAIDTQPGFLSVAYAPDQQTAATDSLGAVEVIFDASGSMWKKLAGGSPRITAARRVLTDLIQNTLPDNTPFALRVFGHRQAKSCRTDLELPLSKLDKAAALKKIADINPQDRSRTPIAASLSAIEKDLDGVAGPRLVLLITDGEETCDGDPEEAIQKLIAAGIDVQINIVGFAIDDESLKQSFRRWSSLGGGDYFDAGSAEQLKASLAESLQPRYTVKDLRGSIVGHGRVGQENLTLAPGDYQVMLGGSTITERVTIRGGKTTDLVLSD